MTRQEEVAEKTARVQALLEKQGLDGLLLTKRPNFAWFSAGGDNHVGNATEVGSSSLLITKEKVFLLADNIEAPRVLEEEVEDLDFEPVVASWAEGGREAAIRKFAGNMKLGSDVPFGETALLDGEVAKLRWSLLEAEIERYRWLGEACALSMTEAIGLIRPQMSEFEVAADVSGILQAVGITPQVLLVAADERIEKFRHPIPTEKRIDKTCMVVICGQRWGLIVSMTRLVHFGDLPKELKRRHRAVCEVDAAIIAGTKPNLTAGKMFSIIKEAYAKAGFPEEWKLHHQGGATGYVGRDWKPSQEDDPTVILENQAFAWNPSISGTKSEDTIIVSKKGAEIISATPKLPSLTIETKAGRIKRADIVEVY